MRYLLFIILLFISYISFSQELKKFPSNYPVMPVEESDFEEVIIDKMGKLKNAANIIINGIGYESENKKFYVGNLGFWTTVPVYNFVDGFWLGQAFQTRYKFNDKYKLSFYPLVYYTTARKKIIWDTKLVFDYKTLVDGKLTFDAGDISSDYDAGEHLGRLENSLYSLVLKRNYMKLFRKRFISLENKFYPLRGLELKSGMSLEWRSNEVNHTEFSIFDDNKSNYSNIPLNSGFKEMPHNTALITNIGFEYIYCRNEYCSTNNNNKPYTNIPIIGFDFTAGIPVGNINRSHFTQIELNIHQRIKTNKFSDIHYKITSGKFLSKHNLWFPDFKHFGAYLLPSLKTYTEDGYYLLGYYKADTDGNWLKGAINYHSRKLMLTQMPFIRKMGFKEGLHARYLWTSAISHYTEWGYSIDYKELITITGFISFEKAKYSNIGISVSFPWL